MKMWEITSVFIRIQLFRGLAVVNPDRTSSVSVNPIWKYISHACIREQGPGSEWCFVGKPWEVYKLPQSEHDDYLQILSPKPKTNHQLHSLPGSERIPHLLRTVHTGSASPADCTHRQRPCTARPLWFSASCSIDFTFFLQLTYLSGAFCFILAWSFIFRRSVCLSVCLIGCLLTGFHKAQASLKSLVLRPSMPKHRQTRTTTPRTLQLSTSCLSWHYRIQTLL